MTPELMYYVKNEISLRPEEVPERIIGQNHVLEQIVNIHEHLTQCLLNGKGKKEIAASLSELMNCTVVMEDSHLRPQFFSIPPKSSPNQMPHASLLMKNSPTYKRAPDSYSKQKRPFQLVDEYSGTIVYRLVSPIVAGIKHLGFISLICLDCRFTELEYLILQHAASVFALKTLEETQIMEVEKRLQGDFVDDLLNGSFADEGSVICRAQGLNYHITLPHRVVLIDINNFPQLLDFFNRNEERIIQFKTDMVNFLKSVLKYSGKGMVVNKSDSFIILLQLEETDNSEKFARQISENIRVKLLNRFPKVNFTIGIGSICSELVDFQNSFRSAQKAIEIGKALKIQGQVLSLEQFGAHALLNGALNQVDLICFAANQIRLLLKYDQRHQTELIPTLQEFLNQRGNAERTARTMNLSLSGLKYRLQRIEEITGRSLKDNHVFFNLFLALTILQLTGEKQILDFRGSSNSANTGEHYYNKK